MIDLVIYKHCTHTLKYANLLAVGLNGSSQTPRVTKGNLELTSLSDSA